MKEPAPINELLETRFSGARVPLSIQESWKRCLASGLKPNSRPELQVLPQTRISDITERESLLVRIARAELEHLFAQIAGTSFMVAFADRNGVVLDRILESGLQGSDAAQSVVVGSRWLEHQRGTNALGLALIEEKPVAVSAGEHFYASMGHLSCFAAPVRNPFGRAVGAIDATTDLRVRPAHTLALINLSAQHIEERLFLAHFADELIVAGHARAEYLDTGSAGLLAVDETGWIVGANETAKAMLSNLLNRLPAPLERVFDSRYETLVERLSRQTIVSVCDRLGSMMHIKIRQLGQRTKPEFVAVQLPRPQAKPAAPAAPAEPEFICQDPTLLSCRARLAEAIAAGAWVCIGGLPGAGKQSLLEAVATEHAFTWSQIGHTADRHSAAPEPDALLVPESFFLEEEADTIQTFLEKMRARPTALIVLRNQGNGDEPPPRRGWFSQFLRIQIPPLQERQDFEKILLAQLRAIHPKLTLHRDAIRFLETAYLPRQIDDLALVLRCAAGQSETRCIGLETIESAHKLVICEEGAPCSACAGFPLRTRQCLAIKRAWKQLDGNVSAVARRLKISRTTIYAHLKT